MAMRHDKMNALLGKECKYKSKCTDRSKRFYTLPMANLFIPIQARLLGEAFRYAAITARKIFTQISSAVYS